MTTKVVVSCPDNSHWYVKVDVRDQVYDPVAKKMTDDWTLAESYVLKQGEQRVQYITSTRKLELSEIEPEKPASTAG